MLSMRALLVPVVFRTDNFTHLRLPLLSCKIYLILSFLRFHFQQGGSFPNNGTGQNTRHVYGEMQSIRMDAGVADAWSISKMTRTHARVPEKRFPGFTAHSCYTVLRSSINEARFIVNAAEVFPPFCPPVDQ